MSEVRRAGAGRDAAGRLVWWSVAEGRRGRRWREATVDGGRLVHSLLLETDPDRRFSHLELSTAAGLLTLHPEPDGTLHGNALAEDGLQHVVGLPWDEDGLVIVDGSALAAAAAAHLLARLQPPGSAPAGMTTSQPTLRIGLDLTVRTQPGDVEPAPAGGWELADFGRLITDDEGLPILGDARSWPLDQGS